VKTFAEFLAHVDAAAAAAPLLSGPEREEYERVCKRLSRAESELRRAIKREDKQKTLSAGRSVARAREARDAFLAPRVNHLAAPARIIYRCAAPWSGPSGSGVHCHEVEMMLDHKDVSGPEYRIVRVLKDEGGPPTNARGAPSIVGVAWFAIADHVKTGKIVVIDEEGPS
jgi:hypothetical protein